MDGTEDEGDRCCREWSYQRVALNRLLWRIMVKIDLFSLASVFHQDAIARLREGGDILGSDIAQNQEKRRQSEFIFMIFDIVRRVWWYRSIFATLPVALGGDETAKNQPSLLCRRLDCDNNIDVRSLYFSIYFNPLFLVLILAIKQVVFDLHGCHCLLIFLRKGWMFIGSRSIQKNQDSNLWPKFLSPRSADPVSEAIVSKWLKKRARAVAVDEANLWTGNR